LVAHGLPADWPAAVVAHGTLPEQQVVCADLSSLAEAVRQAELPSPGLTIVGQVVRLRETLGPGLMPDARVQPLALRGQG
jgi:siroheme synthase